LLNLLRLLSGEIVFFLGVVAEVVEFFSLIFVVADEFVVSVADDAGRFAALVAVVRVVPKEGAVSDVCLFSLKGGNERDAVCVISW